MAAVAPKVSVVVPMRDAGASLPGLFDALDGQTFERDRFEVLVVDDGSRDDSAELARARRGVSVLANARPAGSYAARNLAIAEARGEIVAFTDADCRPQPECARRVPAQWRLAIHECARSQRW